MIAVDTNVLVRIVTADDPAQRAAAVKAIAGEKIRVAKTVLLETAWVLEHAYGLRREVVLEALDRIVAYDLAEIEDEAAVLTALGWADAGLDFADALHLASHGEAGACVTFDRKLAARVAKIECPVPVRILRG